MGQHSQCEPPGRVSYDRRHTGGCSAQDVGSTSRRTCHSYRLSHPHNHRHSTTPSLDLHSPRTCGPWLAPWPHTDDGGLPRRYLDHRSGAQPHRPHPSCANAASAWGTIHESAPSSRIHPRSRRSRRTGVLAHRGSHPGTDACSGCCTTPWPCVASRIHQQNTSSIHPTI
jgi:hypothetical protein